MYGRNTKSRLELISIEMQMNLCVSDALEASSSFDGNWERRRGKISSAEIECDII